MQIKLKIYAVLLSAFLVFAPLTALNANAQTFELHLPSFGLYCENKNADIYGKVKYVIDENGKAIQYSEYTVTSTDYLNFYIPFISNSFNIPEIDISVNGKAVTGKVCYGESYFLDGGLRFYSSDFDENISGTLYSLTTTSDSFTVDFKADDKVNFIYRFTDNYYQNGNCFTVNNVLPDITYEIFVINGEFAEFDSTAETAIETLTVKQYINNNFNQIKDCFSALGNITPELLYAMINRAVENNVNYDFFNLFFDSFAIQRLNAFNLQTDEQHCTITYSMPVNVQVNPAFTPAIYLAEQTTAGNYVTDYTVELNGGFPYIIECSADVQKQSDYIYYANNVTEDFYFVFSASKKPKSNYRNDPTLKIVLCVVAGAAACALLTVSLIILLRYKKAVK